MLAKKVLKEFVTLMGAQKYFIQTYNAASRTTTSSTHDTRKDQNESQKPGPTFTSAAYGQYGTERNYQEGSAKENQQHEGSKENFFTSSSQAHYGAQKNFEDTSDESKANFGYRKVDKEEKQSFVNEVFSSVANKYDLMNDLMSFGIHRIWKDNFVDDIGILRPSNNYKSDGAVEQQGVKVIDVAGGTGDIAFRILDKNKRNKTHLGERNLKVTVFDINQSMLDVGQKRAQNNN